MKPCNKVVYLALFFSLFWGFGCDGSKDKLQAGKFCIERESNPYYQEKGKSNEKKPAFGKLEEILGENKGPISVNKKQIFLLVDKSVHELYVCSVYKDFSVLARFDIATGENPSDKFYEGDKATPEGNYRICQILSSDATSPYYDPYFKNSSEMYDNTIGSLAFKLDYPNDWDFMHKPKKEALGSNIWIHPKPFFKPGNSTKGCICLSYEDFDRLKEYMVKDTTVFIRKHLNF